MASLKARLSYSEATRIVRWRYSEATINNNDPVNKKYLTKIVTYFMSHRIYRFEIL